MYFKYSLEYFGLYFVLGRLLVEYLAKCTEQKRFVMDCYDYQDGPFNRLWKTPRTARISCWFVCEHFFRFYIDRLIWHVGDSKNSRQLCKPETQSKVCITLENSSKPPGVQMRLCKQGKETYCYFKIFLKNTRKFKTSQPCLHTY